MHKQSLFFSVMLFFNTVLLIEAQELQPSLISTAGDSFYGNESMISFSLGEVVIETYAQSNCILTQGFQQTRLDITGIYEPEIMDDWVSVFPNPFKDRIYIQFKSTDRNHHEIELYNLLGTRKLRKEIINLSQDIEIEMNGIVPGTYLLHVQSKSGDLRKVFKLHKID